MSYNSPQQPQPQPRTVASSDICPNVFDCHNARRDGHVHACFYGFNCRGKYTTCNGIHLKERQQCPDGRSCNKLEDPEHRFNYSHGEWAYMIPCKWGDSCRDKNDPKHALKYSHTPFIFPSFDPDMFIENIV